jgi:hypothetical protein
LYEKYKVHGVQFVGVSDEGESTVKKFVTKMGSKMTYSVAIDQSGITNPYRSTFGVRGIPHAFVIDKVWATHSFLASITGTDHVIGVVLPIIERCRGVQWSSNAA